VHVDAPVAELYVESAHGMHIALPVLEKLPAAQDTQAV
jgi:hypothetical protein